MATSTTTTTATSMETKPQPKKTGAQNKAIEQGDKIMAEIQKKKSSYTLPWNIDKRDEQIAELLVSAAQKYKIGKDWNKTAETYILAGEEYEHQKDPFVACGHYKDAAISYKHISPTDAVTTYKRACTIHRDGGRDNTAGNLYEEIGLLEEKNMNIAGAIEAYTEARDCFQSADRNISMNKMAVRVADLASEKNAEYKKAMDIYVEVATSSLGNRMQEYSVTEYFFKAALCKFVLCAIGGNEEETEREVNEVLSEYRDQFPKFEGTREDKILVNCVEAFGKGDSVSFKKHLAKHHKMGKMNSWTISLFDVIEKILDGDVGVGNGLTGGDDLNEDSDSDGIM